ncbi:hypothetical protein HYS42_00135, partial [Candidatus Saccharibacteria bacterium]|nr:hypothetical protein [Candidatus Saccharibacteria bacterium]
MARQKTKICLSCSQLFRGRSDAQTCSERCRKRLYRAKQALVNDAKSIENSAKNALHSATESFKSLQSALAADLLPVADTEAGFIGNTSTPTLQTPPPTPAMPMAQMAVSNTLAPQVRPTPALTPRPAVVPRPPSIPTPSPLPPITTSTVPAPLSPPLPLTATTATVNDLHLSAQAHPPHIPPTAGSLIQPQAREVINPPTSTQPLATTSLPVSTASLPLATPAIPTPVQASNTPSAWSGSTPPQVFSLQSTPSPSTTQPQPLNQPPQIPQQAATQPTPGPGLPPLVPDDTPKSSWTSWFKTRPYALAGGFAALIVISTGIFALSGLLNPSQPSTTNISFQTTDNSVLSTDNSTLTLNLDTVIANGKTLTLGQLVADPTTGILQLTGDFTASGTLGASGGSTFANNSGLVIDKVTVCTSAGCIPNVNIPTVAGSTGTASGTAGAVALLNADQTFTGNNKFNSNSTAAFQIQNANGTSNLLVANTTSSRIGIGTATPAYTLDVAGDINSTTGVRLNGALLCNAAGCTAAGGSNSYIQNGTALQNANFNLQSASITSVTGTIRAATGQTADLLSLKDEAAVNILTIGPTGNTILR